MEYFHLIEFLHGKKTVYLIVINIIILSILFLFVFLSIIMFNLKRRKYFNNIFINILKVFIPSFSISFFGQIFNGLLSASKCENNFSFYDSNQTCGKDFLFLIQEIISIIAIVFLLIIALLVSSIFYIPIIFKGKKELRKISSIPEQILFLNKIIIIILFYLEDYLNERNKSINQWFLIIILVILTGINAYYSFSYKNSKNKNLLLINNIMSLLLFWGFFSLLLGLVLKYINYIKTNYLFLIGGLLIIIYNIYYTNRYQKDYWNNIDKIYSTKGKLHYILKFINVIDKRNNSRKYKIILNSLIEKIELYCINPHCKIKQYLSHLKKGIDSSLLLYGYCDKIFRETISKNKNDITTIIYYIVFIMTRLNKRKKAQMLLKQLDDRQLILFQDLFNIYRAKQLLEDLTLNPHYNDNKINIMRINMIQYKRYLKEFKSMLYRISTLYLNFWTLLIDSHNNQNENIENLNNTGKEIKDLAQIIDEYFNKLYNFRNEVNIMKLYLNFIQNVLFNNKQYEKYNKILMNISLEYKKLNNEEDFSNYDINRFKSSDENQWMIISSDDKDYGKILNISLSVCPIIGYKKNEIIGNNINILIPNIFVKSHNHMLKKLFFNTKCKFYETQSKSINYIPEQISKIVFCKNKLKYLVPFPFKSFFVQTEEGEHVFIINIIKQKCFPHSNNKKKEEPWCCVLTDKQLFIQTFTPNAFDILGLNTNDIDSHLNISNCISQFGKDIFNNMNNNVNTIESNEYYNYSSDANYESSKGYFNANTIKSENILRREITKKDFSTPQVITWKFINEPNKLKFRNNTIKYFPRNNSEKYEIKVTESHEKKFLLRIKESKINNELIGYKFLFRKIAKDQKELLVLKNSNNNNNNYQVDDDILESGISDISLFNDNSSNLPSPTSKLKERDSLKRYDSSLSLAQFEKPIIYAKRRHSLGNFQQRININNFAHIFKVDPNFIPTNRANFIFDLKTMSYTYHHQFYKHSSGHINNDALLEQLVKESKEKISILHNYEMSKKAKSLSDNDEIVSSGNDSSSDSSSESQSSNSIISSFSHKSKTQKEKNSEHKHYNSFMIQKNLKSKEGLEKIHQYESKETTKSNFAKKKKSIKDPHLLDQLVIQMKEKNRKSLEYKFHEINLKNIRFMKYDFYKEMIVEEFDFDKVSKMYKIMNEIKNDFNNMTHKDEDYPSVSINQFALSKKNNKKDSITKKRNHFDKPLELDKITNSKEKKENDFKLEKEKKIIEALSKKDKQHSITKFLIISIFCLLLLYTICGINLYLYITKVSEDKENINLICESTDLQFYFYSAVYCVREITLLNMKDIKGISHGTFEGYSTENKTQLIGLVDARILVLYSLIHNLNEEIISTELPFSKNTSYYLNEKEFILETITSDFKIISLRTGLSNALISLDAYLYNIAELTTPIEQSNEDIYPFIHNTLNTGGLLLDLQIELYLNELKIRGKKNKILLCVGHCIIILVLILILIILSNSYSSFLKTKANYFYIFYGISLETIYSLINKCEFFLQKLKKEQKELNEENEENQDEEDDESSFIYPGLKSIQAAIIDNNINYNIVSQNRRKGGGLNNMTLSQKISKENNIIYKFSPSLFIIYFSIFLSIFLIYLLIIINNYFTFVNLIYEYGLYAVKLSKYQNDIIAIFNAYREFLFDQNTIIDGKLSNDYIDDKIKEMYSTKFDDNVIFSKYRQKIPGYLEKYNELRGDNPCLILRIEKYFHSEEECRSHMHGISTYGISVVHTSFTEEIRTYKNIINTLLNANIIVGNLTLYGSIYWSEENITNELKNQSISNDTTKYYRLFLLNDNAYQKDLNILFINLIYAFFKDERRITVESINESIKNKEITYIVFYTCLLIIISLLFLIYWLPMINRMNITIYKTKKMLSIIPIRILASQENINGLLNIEIDTNYKQIDNSNNNT